MLIDFLARATQNRPQSAFSAQKRALAISFGTTWLPLLPSNKHWPLGLGSLGDPLLPKSARWPLGLELLGSPCYLKARAGH